MGTEEREYRPFVQSQRTEMMLDLCEVVKRTGSYVLGMPASTIIDTEEVGGHQFSTVDTRAGSALLECISAVMSGFVGDIVEEAEALRAASRGLNFPILVGDAVEGSTNTKRGLTAAISRPILGGTSVMVLENRELSSIVACAVYDFASRQVYSAVRAEPGSFLPFLDGKLIPQQEVRETRGDSQKYVVVPGYSHGNIKARCQVEEAIQAIGAWPTGGCRSSLQDLLNMLCNQIDGYVDLRALFPGGTHGRDEVLHPWDVGGILPVLDGLGFTITDENGVGWQKHCFGDPLTLIAARPSLAQRVLEAVRELPFVNLAADEAAKTFPMPTRRIGET